MDPPWGGGTIASNKNLSQRRAQAVEPPWGFRYHSEGMR